MERATSVDMRKRKRRVVTVPYASKGYRNDIQRVTFRVTQSQRDELDAEGARLNITGNEVARRRAFPGAATAVRVVSYTAIKDAARNEAAGANLDELLVTPWLNDFTLMPGWHRWSKWDRLLVAEYDKGNRHIVVAKIIEGDTSGLPEFEPPKKGTKG
jgi:hypothetical protein